MSSSVSISDVTGVTGAASQAALEQNISQPSAQSPSLPQDTVSISNTAHQLAQSTAAIVQQLHVEGVPTEIIAAELDSTPESVQSYITVATLAASA